MWSANKKIRVMVVDDSIMARTLITQGLTKDPQIEVVGTGFNARDAMSKVAQLQPDVMTLDVEMPGMSGIDLAAEIRDRDPGLPVLILTGHAEAMQIPDDLPVLTKPFRSADLAARVATLLDGGAEPAT